jgi:ribosomal-protein-alanine N-acetyltransferase
VPGAPDVSTDRAAFEARCRARARERNLGAGYGYGIFVGIRFAGEINIGSVQRGPFQSAHVGYWIDKALAGRAYVPEAMVVLCRFAFEEAGLHRLQVAIIPRNRPSRRVVEKLGIREEGLARRYLEINGAWEDHVCYAITAEEWDRRRGDLLAKWAFPDPER